MKNFLATFLFLALFSGCKEREDITKLPQREEVFPVRVSLPLIKEVEYTFDAVGSFLPYDEVTVRGEVDGRIEKVLVDEGDHFKKGDLLVVIDSERLRYEVENAKAALKEAEANLINTRRLLSRKAQLYQEKVVSQQIYDDTVTQVALAEAAVEKVRSRLKLAQRDLRDTKVYAPFPGAVTKKIASEGGYIGKMVGNSLLTIVSTNPLKLYFTIPERYASQIHIGQAVRAKVKAYPDEEFGGQIYSINPKVDPSTRSLEIKAYVPNKEGRLKPGFFADVFLLVGVNKRALLFPEESVMMKEGKHIIFVVSSDVAHQREVTTGIRVEGMVEIASGLKEDELVVTSGFFPLYEGARIRVQKEG